MKVIQINGTGYYGSTAKIVRLISNILDEKGVENKIICSGYKEKSLSDEKTICISGRVRIKFHQYLGFILGSAGFHSNLVTRRLIAYLKKEKPDIVHLHHLEGFFVNVKMLLKFLRKEKIKTICTLHDCWMFTGHCTHFTVAKCDRWKTQCEKCSQLKKYPYSLFLDRSKRLFRIKKKLLEKWEDFNVVNVSRWMDGVVAESFLRNRKRQVVYNGIDTEKFCVDTNAGENLRRELNLEDKFLILGVASTWGEQKGLDKFIQLSKIIPNDWRIILVGLSESQKEQMPENIIGIERVRSQEKLKDFYNLADVFLSLSLEETMGLVTVEAMACGTPAVVFNSTASPELINENVGKILYQQDIEYIKDVLMEVYQKGKEFYSSECRKHAEQNFSEKRMQEDYYNCYRRVYEEK